MKNKISVYLFVGLFLVALFYVATLVYKKSQKEKLDFLTAENSAFFVRDHAPRFGDQKAKVVMVEFLDPECESCRFFYPIVKSMLGEFDNKVQLVVRYAPFHKNSKIAIKAIEAARLQGKYWAALELLFYYQPQWGDHHDPKPELIFEYLPSLDLDMEKLKTDMESPEIQAIIDQDELDMRTLNVRGTPTFFVNGKPLEDFSEEGLRMLLESEVKSVYP